MRPVLTCILLLSLVIQLFSGSFILLDYKLNTRDYARRCENKARPKMHCNGKCQMFKKIKEQQEKEDKQENTKKEWVTVLFIPAPAAFLLSFRSSETPLKHHAVYTFASGSGFCPDIFHPPACS